MLSEPGSRMSARAGRRRQQFQVGEKIRELRKARRITQAELANRIGVQQSDLCRMETGEYKVSLDTLFRILSIFGLNIGEFFHEPATPAEPTEEEILRLWRRLDDSGREEVRSFMLFKTRREDRP